MDAIRIQMMGGFSIYVNERQMEFLSNKSRKGAALVQFLILHEGQPVPNYRILSALWRDERGANPENALKTLVSRVRVLLNQLSEGLGSCLVADRGAYHWALRPQMSVDLYEIDDIFRRLETAHTGEAFAKLDYARLVELYRGDLLQGGEVNDWALSRATSLHNMYIEAVYDYIELLKRDDSQAEIINVCRSALNVDNFDDRLNIELMGALLKANRTGDAMAQYKHVTQLHYRYLGITPSEELQTFFKQIVDAGKMLSVDLDAIRSELQEDGGQQGPFFCEYAVFKEIFNLQMRNLERLGSTMFLAVIMASSVEGEPMDAVRQDNIMSGLRHILQENLRKGDTVAQYSPTTYALLLPTVDYSTGNMVMERIRRVFYGQYPHSSIAFNYRIAPLSVDKRKGGKGERKGRADKNTR